jgi:hypothetical protein
MKGFLLGGLVLTFGYALLQGQTTGKGGNVAGLLGVPGSVAKRLLDPDVPFFSKAASSAGAKPTSASTTPAAAPPRVVLT